MSLPDYEIDTTIDCSDMQLKDAWPESAPAPGTPAAQVADALTLVRREPPYRRGGYYYRVMNCWARTVAGRLAGSRGSAAGGASARPRGDGAGSRSRPGCVARGARGELRGRWPAGRSGARGRGRQPGGEKRQRSAARKP